MKKLMTLMLSFVLLTAFPAASEELTESYFDAIPVNFSKTRNKEEFVALVQALDAQFRAIEKRQSAYRSTDVHFFSMGFFGEMSAGWLSWFDEITPFVKELHPKTVTAMAEGIMVRYRVPPKVLLSWSENGQADAVIKALRGGSAITSNLLDPSALLSADPTIMYVGAFIVDYDKKLMSEVAVGFQRQCLGRTGQQSVYCSLAAQASRHAWDQSKKNRKRMKKRFSSDALKQMGLAG